MKVSRGTLGSEMSSREENGDWGNEMVVEGLGKSKGARQATKL